MQTAGCGRMITPFNPPFMARFQPLKPFFMQILIIIYPTIRCGPERGQCGMGRAFF
jgi:hypothetical protein